jgi:diguanylate cyclase (GGDEF)-like protein
MNFPHLPYVVMEGYCFLYAFTILLRMNSNIGSQDEIRALKAMIYSYFVMLVTDIFYYFVEDDILGVPLWLNYGINGLEIASISFGCYFWFRFVEARLRPHFSHQKLADWLFAIPLAFIVVCDIVSLFNGWLFYITPEGHFQDRGDIFSWVQGTVNYFYLILPTIYSLFRAFRTRARLEKIEYFIYAAYMVAPLVSGLLEDSLSNVPILALNIFLIIHIIFLTIQNMQIYNDALTDLNNPRHLNQFLEERLPTISADRPLTLYMLDVNGFKAINDTYGHVDGDYALKMMGFVLKQVGVEYGAFPARYGGDEFCFVVDKNKTDPQVIADRINQALAAAQKNPDFKPLPFNLSVSIGYATRRAPEKDPNALIAEADEMLYAQKNEWHKKMADCQDKIKKGLFCRDFKSNIRISV